MRKLSLLFMTLMVMAVGWNRAYGASGDSKIPDNSYYVTLLAVEGVNTNTEYQVGDVYYSTATQSRVPMPQVYEEGFWNYYVPKDENPTQIHVIPHTGNAIYAVAPVGGKSVRPLPDGFTLYTSDIDAATSDSKVEIKVYVASEPQVRTATMTITADNPADLVVQCRSNSDRAKYYTDDFVDGKLIIKYSPHYEGSWVISRADNKDVAKVVLNGTALTREQLMINTGPGEWSIRQAFTVTPGVESLNNTVEVSRDYADIDIPVTILVENDGGNEYLQEKLRSVITEVSGGGKKYTVDEWTSPDFTVKNGTDLYVNLREQAYGVWEITERTLNGVKTTKTSFKIEGDDATPQTIVIRGLINTPWRYNVKAENYDKFLFRVLNSDVNLESDNVDAEVDYNLPASVFIQSINSNDYKVTGVKYNGESVAPTYSDRYEFYIDKQDSEIEIDCSPYLRDKVMPVLLGNDKFNQVDIILNPGGIKEKRVELTENCDVHYNPADLPIEVKSANSDVYVDNVRQTPDENGYYLADYTGGKVKIFNKTAAPGTVTHAALPAGVEAIITHDGDPVQPGQTYSVAPGTVVKYTITKGNDLVLENGMMNFVEPDADGNFTLTVNYHAGLSLHQANPYFNVSAEQLKSLYVELLEMDDYVWHPYVDFSASTGTTDKVVLPYLGDGEDFTKDYSIKLTVPTRNYKITGVTSTPSGASFDAETSTVTGIKSGMTLNVTTEVNAKPYSLHFDVAVPEGWYSRESEYGGFKEWFYTDEYGDEKQVDMQETMPFNLMIKGGDGPIFLQLGANNSSTNPMGDEWDYFSLSAEDFPVTIIRNLQNYTGETYTEENVPAMLFINNEKLEFKEEEVEMWEGYSEKQFIVRIEEPQSFTARCYFEKLEPASMTINSTCALKYKIDEGESVDLAADKFVNLNIYPEQKVYIYPEEGVQLTGVKCTASNAYGYGESVTEMLSKEGKAYVFTAPRYKKSTDYFDNWSTNIFDVTVQRPMMNVSVNAQNNKLSVYVIGGAAAVVDYNTMTWSVVKSSQITLKAQPDYYITRVVNLADNSDLPFDPRTGVVSSVTPGMNLRAYVQPLARNSKLTLVADNSLTLDKDVKVTLASGAIYQNVLTLTKRKTGSAVDNSLTVNYSNIDLPIDFSEILYSGRPANLYYNCTLLHYDAEEGYHLPADIESGSVIRIVKADAKQTVPVKFVIDPDLSVDITVDGRTYGQSSLDDGMINVPVGSAVRIATLSSNKYNYTATYAALSGASSAEGNAMTSFRITDSYDAVTVTAEKVYNVLTVTGADPSLLTVTDDSREYTPTDDNTFKVPEMVKTVKIVTNQPDSYIAGISADVEGLSFDAKTGLLSGIATATYAVDVKTFDRSKSIDIQVESDDCGGEIVMAQGAIWQHTSQPAVGIETLSFASEHLPLIYRPADPQQLPIVYVDGVKVEYDAENHYFLLAADDYDGTDEVSLVKIYPWQGEGVDDVTHPRLTYMVENGIGFQAVEDKRQTISEPCTRVILPGTDVELTINTAEGDDPTFVELNGVRIEPVDGKYSFKVETADVTVAVQRVKKSVTFVTDEWQGVRVSGQGMEYPLFDTHSTLQFPLATTAVTVSVTAPGKIVTGAVDEADQPLAFDAAKGEISGITGDMTIRLLISDYQRDTRLYVYLEETDEQADAAVSHLVLATGSNLEATQPLARGYQELTIGERDMPLSFVCDDDVIPVVYLNGEAVEAGQDGSYLLPAPLPAVSVLKVYTDEQPGIEVAYNLDNELYDIAVTHDRVVTIATPDKHTVLPGTEISLTVARKTQSASVRARAPREATVDHLVTVNGEKLTPQPDGSYLIKATRDHAATGINVTVEHDDAVTSIDSILVDGTRADVYNLQGILLMKDATRADVNRLTPGIYIISGRKVAVKL